MNVRKHRMERIGQETASVLHHYSLFSFFTGSSFQYWGDLWIEVQSALDLCVETTHRMPTCQRTAVGDAYYRVQCFKTDWSDSIIAGNTEGLLLKQIVITKQVKFKIFALFSKIFDINICIPYQKWDIGYSIFFI